MIPAAASPFQGVAEALVHRFYVVFDHDLRPVAAICQSSSGKQPQEQPICMARTHHSMARIDGSKRSAGLPLRCLRPALTAVPQICRVASREALLISVCLPAMRAAASRMPRLVLGSPQYATTSRVRARSFFALAKPAACKNRTDAVIGSRALYSRCGPNKVREQFNNSRCAPRYAGCRARCPKANNICFPESARGVAYARPPRRRMRPIGERR